MDDQNKDESNTSREEGGQQEVEDGPEGDHAAHLSIEACRAGDEAGNDERKYHQLEESHEEFPGVGDEVDGLGV